MIDGLLHYGFRYYVICVGCLWLRVGRVVLYDRVPRRVRVGRVQRIHRVNGHIIKPRCRSYHSIKVMYITTRVVLLSGVTHRLGQCVRFLNVTIARNIAIMVLRHVTYGQLRGATISGYTQRNTRRHITIQLPRLSYQRCVTIIRQNMVLSYRQIKRGAITISLILWGVFRYQDHRRDSTPASRFLNAQRCLCRVLLDHRQYFVRVRLPVRVPTNCRGVLSEMCTLQLRRRLIITRLGRLSCTQYPSLPLTRPNVRYITTRVIRAIRVRLQTSRLIRRAAQVTINGCHGYYQRPSLRLLICLLRRR